MRSFMRFAAAGVAAGLFLGGCATEPVKPPVTAIDQPDFVDAATGEVLHLGLRGPYTMIRPQPAGTPVSERTRRGHWDLLSAEYQVITLDGTTPVRLSYRPGAKLVWEYRPIALTGYSAILPEQRDHYVTLSGQYSAAKADLERAADEQSLTEMLEPAARGAR